MIYTVTCDDILINYYLFLSRSSRRGSSRSFVVPSIPPSPSLSNSSLVLSITPTTSSIISDKASLVSPGLSRNLSERHSKCTLSSLSPSILECRSINEEITARGEKYSDKSSDTDTKEEGW